MRELVLIYDQLAHTHLSIERLNEIEFFLERTKKTGSNNQSLRLLLQVSYRVSIKEIFQNENLET